LLAASNRQVAELERLGRLMEQLAIELPVMLKIDPATLRAKAVEFLKRAGAEPKKQAPADWSRLAVLCLILGARS
jgi:hypothetical protein